VMMVEMNQCTVEMIGQERAAGATRGPIRPEHEVIDDQLTASGEQIGERLFARGCREAIILLDLHPGQRQPFGVDGVAQMCGFFLSQQQRAAGLEPFVARHDSMLHHGGLSRLRYAALAARSSSAMSSFTMFIIAFITRADFAASLSCSS